MKTKQPRRLRQLKERQAKINQAQSIIDKLRPGRDRLIRDFVDKGAGIRELATEIGVYPSTITRVCQQPPPITPHRKGWAGGNGNHS